MRRFLLLIALLSLLFACASGPEVPEEQVAETAPEAAEEVPAPPEADAETEPEPEPDDPGPVEEPTPLTLVLVNPADPEVVTRPRFLLSVLPSRGVIETLQVELVDGRFAPDSARPFALVSIADLPSEDRRFEFPGDADPLTVTVPAGFVDGERYELRIRGVTEDGEVSEWLELSPRLSLGLEPPTVSTAGPTIDTTPAVAVDSDRPFELYVDDEWAGIFPPGGPVETGPLAPGAYAVAARSVSEDGYVTRIGAPTRLVVRPDASPAPAWPVSGRTTLTSSPGLQWGAVTGAVGYQARYRLAGQDIWNQTQPVLRPRVPIPDPLQQGGSYEWQVRAQNDAGTWFSWSRVEQFVVGGLSFDFVRIIGIGQSVTLTRGYESGSRDEAPVRQILLTRPFEMARSPLTNAEIARLVAYGQRIGFVEIDADGVWTVEEERRPLVGIGAMDYGIQFGLEYSDGQVVPRPGYESHPAVGVTWLGAVQIANLLSYVEGVGPAYDADGNLLPDAADGYRLPTEAEWEYAARGTSAALLPWGGSLSGRVSNYYRSFDPFEDVNEPFTGSGGPTNPVGFFNGTAQNGFQTANDASPFGVRDMVGNVWEWCYDRYGATYYASSPASDPVGPNREESSVANSAIVLAGTLDPDQRVVRGSAWNTREPDVRITNRGRYAQLGRSYSIGVRLVRSPRQ